MLTGQENEEIWREADGEAWEIYIPRPAPSKNAAEYLLVIFKYEWPLPVVF